MNGNQNYVILPRSFDLSLSCSLVYAVISTSKAMNDLLSSNMLNQDRIKYWRQRFLSIVPDIPSPYYLLPEDTIEGGDVIELYCRECAELKIAQTRIYLQTIPWVLINTPHENTQILLFRLSRFLFDKLADNNWWYIDCVGEKKPIYFYPESDCLNSCEGCYTTLETYLTIEGVVSELKEYQDFPEVLTQEYAISLRILLDSIFDNLSNNNAVNKHELERLLDNIETAAIYTEL